MSSFIRMSSVFLRYQSAVMLSFEKSVTSTPTSSIVVVSHLMSGLASVLSVTSDAGVPFIEICPSARFGVVG